MAAASSVSSSATIATICFQRASIESLEAGACQYAQASGSEKSAYWRITVPCVVARYTGDIGSLDVDALPLPLPAKDHYAMVLLARILGANEGLLSNAIRDKGLGYSPKLLYDSTMQTCTLVCNKTSNIGEAYDVLKDCAAGNQEQLGPAELIGSSSRWQAKHRWANEHLRAVTLDDLRHVFNTFVMPLVDREQSPAITVVISSDDSCSGIGEQALESKQLEALFD
ncbi:hypothetical protein DL89DRAFT_260071 [Linderina pennispora]|uniref:Uncharacterized protein n=1 Tax=Linderina pennispora TaxID=61395 RepID=A0A1Y1VZY9_9FUNG|nr:uncharacterized protein DL89DRAFT_260071 [Linderina pennispora]ORX66414.1 hypothetical protein DL89DRAFT_260071 [Linderina pennispora]